MTNYVGMVFKNQCLFYRAHSLLKNSYQNLLVNHASLFSQNKRFFYKKSSNNLRNYKCFSTLRNSDKILQNHFYFHPDCTEKTSYDVSNSFTVVPSFVNDNEEAAILKDVEPHLKRLRYEYKHFDDVSNTGNFKMLLLSFSEKSFLIIFLC